MKKNQWKYLVTAVLLVAGVYSCQGSEEESVEDLQEGLKELEEELVAPPMWQEVRDGRYFSVELPMHMYPWDSLNADASLQYGYAGKVEEVTREHYVIVMIEDKDSIAKKEEQLNLHLDLDLKLHNELCLENMGVDFDKFEFLTSDPEPQTTNGLTYMVNEMRGEKGSVHIYYRLAVYEGERAFYQLLTWCLESQQEVCEEDMSHMIESFKELDEDQIMEHEGHNHEGHNHDDHNHDDHNHDGHNHDDHNHNHETH